MKIILTHLSPVSSAETWYPGYKTFHIQLSMFIMLIDVNMSTIVGILTFISRINTLYECFKQENCMFVFPYFYLENSTSS